MVSHAGLIKLKTKPKHFYDLTEQVKQIVKESEVAEGICSVFCKGSTATILLNENNPMLLSDIKTFVEKMVPENKLYQHPDNAFSHIRSMMFSSNSQIIPIEESEMILGQWQNILFFELDVEERDREVIVTVIGE